MPAHVGGQDGVAHQPPHRHPFCGGECGEEAQPRARQHLEGADAVVPLEEARVPAEPGGEPGLGLAEVGCGDAGVVDVVAERGEEQREAVPAAQQVPDAAGLGQSEGHLRIAGQGGGWGSSSVVCGPLRFSGARGESGDGRALPG